MATFKHKPSCKGQVKKIVLHDLLNFSESSEDEQASHTLCSPVKPKRSSVKSEHQTVRPEQLHIKSEKQDEGKHCLHDDKENSQNKKPAIKEKVDLDSGGNIASTTKIMSTKSRECKSRTKTNSSAAQNTEGVLAGKMKKGACMKAKARVMTLADLGISFNFSESSDNGEEEEREQAQPISKKDLPLKDEGRANPKKPSRLCRRKVKNDSERTNVKSGVEPSKCGVRTERDTVAVSETLSSADPHGGKVKSSATCQPVSLPNHKHSVNDIGTKVSMSNCKVENVNLNEVKTGITTLKTKLRTVASSGKSKHTKNLLLSDAKKNYVNSDHRSVKYQAPLQHPDVSVIRAAHFADSLMVDASPSEESLLPLSESTRLDCPENVKATKQSFGHLLAHQSSPQLFDSSIGDSQNSSYEQLKIVKNKSAAKLQTGNSQNENEKEQKLTQLEDGRTVSGPETPESSSLYMTCLATPDVSSMYEVVDVSVQTSFKGDAAATADVEEARTHDAGSPADKAGSGDSVTNRGKVHAEDVNPSQLHKGSEDVTESIEHVHHTESALVPDIEIQESMPIAVSAKKEESLDDDESPVLSPDVDAYVEAEHLNETEEVDESCEEGTGAVHPMSSSSHHARSKIPSDSNYYSESRSDVNTSSSPGMTANSLKRNSHEALASLPLELQDLKLCSNVSEGEEEGAEQECEGGGTASTARQKSSPSGTSLPSSCEPRGGWGAKSIPGSSTTRQSAKRHDSSSEDDSDKLEAFLLKMRTQAQPAKKIAEDDDLDEFIVDDSDVTDSEEDNSDDDGDDLADVLGSDILLESLPKTRSARRDVPKASATQDTARQDGTGSSGEDEDEDDDDDDDAGPFSSDDTEEDDEEDDDCFQGLTTPRSKVIPPFSRSQTPRDSSSRWYTPATSKKTKPRRAARREDSSDSSSSSLVVPSAVQGKGKREDAWTTPACLSSHAGGRNAMRPLSFLKSLSITTPDHLRDQEARSYITNFKRRQEELSSRLFQLFNFTVFENQLPADLPVVWNKRLLKTAGLCKQKRVNDRYTASIELSTKVCDSAERVRDTLVHEMCHAAVWILNKAKEGHGPHWKYWARKANRAHPEIPIIRRCHDYRINTKFIYRCVDCGYQIGRHSKSLDTERKVCGHCHGRFQLLTSGSRCGSAAASVSATPRTPNPFALFVKENYGSVKRDGGGLPHKEVMEALSKQFAKTKINFS